MADEPLPREALIDECLSDKLRRTGEVVGEVVLLFFLREYVRFVRVLLISRERDPESFTFLLDDVVGEARVRIGSLEDGRDPELLRGPQGLERTKRPQVDDVDVVPHPPEPARHDAIVQRKRSQIPENPIGQPKASVCQRGSCHRCFGKRPLDGRRTDDDVRSGADQAGHLLPCGLANASGADPVREAIENTHRTSGPMVVGHGRMIARKPVADRSQCG